MTLLLFKKVSSILLPVQEIMIILDMCHLREPT